MGDVRRYFTSLDHGTYASPMHDCNDQVVKASDFDAGQSELAALREELADLAELKAYITIPLRERCDERKDLQQRLADAERRNAELIEWCAKKCEERAAYYESGDDDAPGSRRAAACQNCADVIRWNKPTESGASE